MCVTLVTARFLVNVKLVNLVEVSDVLGKSGMHVPAFDGERLFCFLVAVVVRPLVVPFPSNYEYVVLNDEIVST